MVAALGGDAGFDVLVEAIDLGHGVWSPTVEGDATAPGIVIARSAADELGVAVGEILGEVHPVVGDMTLLAEDGDGIALGGAAFDQLLDQVVAEHPNIHLRISDGTSSLLEDQLAIGELDLALVNLPLHREDLVAEPLFGQVIEPLLYGHSTGLSPFAVIVSRYGIFGTLNSAFTLNCRATRLNATST